MSGLLLYEMPAIHPPDRESSGRNSDYFRVSSQAAVDRAIAAVAARQHGNISRRQLLDLGLDDDAIRYRLKIGRLYRVFRGVYSVGNPAISPQQLASAAVLACGQGAALSHSSAMTLWGYWRQWDKPLEVTVIGDRRTKGVRVHRSTTLRRQDITTQLGIRVSTPARTALDMSPRLNDTQMKRVVKTMLGSPWSNEDQFAEMVARHPCIPGAKRIAKLLGLPGTQTRSHWEDDFPDFCAKYGLPEPVMGEPFHGYILDALFVVERVIVELDSWRFHKSKPAFEDDRERDATTLAHGLVTVRITEERLEERPEHEAKRLHTILRRRRPGRGHAPRAA